MSYYPGKGAIVEVGGRLDNAAPIFVGDSPLANHLRLTGGYGFGPRLVAEPSVPPRTGRQKTFHFPSRFGGDGVEGADLSYEEPDEFGPPSSRRRRRANGNGRAANLGDGTMCPNPEHHVRPTQAEWTGGGASRADARFCAGTGNTAGGAKKRGVKAQYQTPRRSKKERATTL